MNLKFPLRRTAAVAAGALIGLTGVVALAGPASAHHPVIVGGTSCVNEDGTWQVEWKIVNSENDLAGTITNVELTPATTKIYGIGPETPLPILGQGSITAVQSSLQATDTAANIKVTAEWLRNGETVTSSRTSEVPVTKSDEVCKETTNPTPSPTVTPSTTPSATPSATPSTTPSATPSATVSEEPSTPPKPTKEPEFVYDETCDTVTVGITVPKDWHEDITVDFVTSEGDSKTVVGKRGETTTVEFPAVDGMTITATPKGYEGEDATITYEQPEDCGGSGGGEEPSLPLTGAAAGSIAGGAAVLLAVGAGLFFMARRRKVKFTA
ncbi:LPXTG cell wall anchor domain-containing protein [Actinoplanes sp. NPDC049668]|uniref:LPXTG cell wall anchor domain-containing protein n=1 Tax=unclassified Actinoplanes TaxID=2626549 RepID=UPI0033A9EA3B